MAGGMETVIERILGHPLLTVALLLLCVLMLYALFKRLLKMLAYLAVAVTAYFDTLIFSRRSILCLNWELLTNGRKPCCLFCPEIGTGLFSMAISPD